jgi:glycerol kinase
MAGDQQAALIGQCCVTEGMVKSTYGTGCFALMNIGETFRQSENRLLTTTAYRFDGKPTYAIEGAIFVAGAVIQWLRDNLGILKNSAESEALARSVPDNNGVYFVPAFTGLGAPHWNPHARAAISGLTRESTKAHIARAALEAQAYQTLDLMDAMAKDGGHNPQTIRADGGLVANSFMCQFLADMIARPVEVPIVHETTALGAAYLAGLQAGVYNGLDDLSTHWALDKRYEPAMESAMRDGLYRGWQEAVRKI